MFKYLKKIALSSNVQNIVPIFAAYLKVGIKIFCTKTLLIKTKEIIIMAYVIGNDCIACGTCIDECPVGAISEGDIYKIDPDACTECGTCAEVCPNEAISLP